MKYPGEVSRGQQTVIRSLLQPQTHAAHNLLQEIKLFRVRIRIKPKAACSFSCCVSHH